MKRAVLTAMTAATLIGLGGLISVRAEDESSDEMAALAATAKFTEAQAAVIALIAVPNGTIKASALEDENGTPVWAFDLTTPNSTQITQVKVDAVTGNVVPEDQTAEGLNEDDSGGPEVVDGEIADDAGGPDVQDQFED